MLSLPRAQVQSLVRELKSYKLHSVTRGKKKIGAVWFIYVFKNVIMVKYARSAKCQQL